MTNVWAEILEVVRAHIPEEDFRRWFGATAYASDAGDRITVWVPTEAIRRHIATHYQQDLDRALAALGRADTELRMVVGGVDDDEDE